jgi:hypothetical protein
MRSNNSFMRNNNASKLHGATYEALLAAGAPEPTACAAALNPQVFQAVAPTYLNRPAR